MRQDTFFSFRRIFWSGGRWRFLANTLLGSILLTLVLVVFCYWRIEVSSSNYVYSNVDEVPFNHVGLVLGTSKNLQNGQSNPYFTNRIRAAARLYHSGKISRIILSGDNGSIYYNEPVDMKRALLRYGVPEKNIYLDYAGFRTLDSVIRCQKVFGQSRFTVISQEFHNKRAVFISRKTGIEAVAFNASDLHYNNMGMDLRECLARVKAFLDIYLLKEQPRFLGDRIPVF